MNNRKKQAKTLRTFRKIHRTTGASLFILFFVVSISGLLLGWKKNSYGMLLPASQRGVSTDLKDWLPLDTLQTIAFHSLQKQVDQDIDLSLQRIDARPDKGIVKFIFEHHYWGVQIDGTTGAVLSISLRRSDLIENIHDGSILDTVFKTGGGILKLLYTSLMGIALLIFTITGFWLWYGPKRMRRMRKVKHN